MADRYNNIFTTINSLALNARQTDGAEGCLCGGRESPYSAAASSEIQRGVEFRRVLHCHDHVHRGGSDGSCPRDMNDEEEGSSQKLRFTKPQVRLLEHTFQTLQRPNCYQKADLARELGVQPRQVDIWFQNRRARGKAKATDSDCDILRQRCQDLIAENHQLNLLIQSERMSYADSLLYNNARVQEQQQLSTDQVGTDQQSRSASSGHPTVQIQMILCNSCKKLKSLPPV
ncbi:hypothetical protein CY35_15G033500 [Sphagnum magellanicum]|nr:hypothetical protein CY35_15G033500 [Sphagnum magellanicum]